MKTTLALAALAAIIVSPVLAETPPPEKGWYGTFSNAMIVCDTQAQIVSIVDAAKAKPNGGAQAKYDELKIIKDAKGEPACAIGRLGPVAVGESVDLGKVEFIAGKWAHGWAVHIGTAQGEWWILYLDPTTAPINMDAPMLLPHHLLRI